MTLTLSIASLRMHNACGLDKRIADIRRVLPDVTDDTPVPLRTWWDLPTTSVEDRWWSLRAVEPSLDAHRDEGAAPFTVAHRGGRSDAHSPGEAIALALLEVPCD